MIDLTKMSIDWNEVEAFFYRGMLDGWASGRKAAQAPVEGYKCMQHKEEGFTLLDMWTKASGSMGSSGVTTIYIDSASGSLLPIWTMHYGGWYSDAASELVKTALRVEYEMQLKTPSLFSGCRGCRVFETNGMNYRNTLQPIKHWWIPGETAHFGAFEGYEKVEKSDETILGYHKYFGHALL